MNAFARQVREALGLPADLECHISGCHQPATVWVYSKPWERSMAEDVFQRKGCFRVLPSA